MWGGKVTAGYPPSSPRVGATAKLQERAAPGGVCVVSHGSPVPLLPAPKSAVPGKPRRFWGYWEGWWP